MSRTAIVAITGTIITIMLLVTGLWLMKGSGGAPPAQPVEQAAQPAEPGNGEEAPPARTVLVAASPLAKGELLGWEDWVVGEEVPDQMPALALEKGDQKALAGAAATRSIEAGEILAESMVVRPGQHGFLPTILAPGHRAVGINVTHATREAGLVRAGDRVDVVLTAVASHTEGVSAEKLPVNVEGAKLTRVLLEDIRVLAIDRRIHDMGEEDEAREEQAPFGLATVEVTQRQVPVLIHAEQIGDLSLVVRSERKGNGRGGRDVAVHVKELLLPGVKRDRSPLEAVHQVQVIRGRQEAVREVFDAPGGDGS